MDESKKSVGYYGYSNTMLICGECSHFMDASKSDHSVRPFVYRVVCTNPTCKNNGILFRVGEGAKVLLEPVQDLDSDLAEREKHFIQAEKDRMDVIARKIADLIQLGQPSMANRFTWEEAYHGARELVSKSHHPGGIDG